MNEDTSTLHCLSKIWVFDVDGPCVSVDEVVPLLTSSSVLVISTDPSMSTYSEIGFSLYILCAHSLT